MSEAPAAVSATAPVFAPAPDRATAIAERQWGPDLARGFALLGIVVANMYYYLTPAAPGILLKSPGQTGTDLAVDIAATVFFDNRGFPLFSLLFGFGIGMLHARSVRRGESSERFLVQMLKRHGLLLAIGVLHAVLLFAGDIVTTYAVLGMVVCLLAVAPRWVPILVAALSVPAVVLIGAADAFSAVSVAPRLDVGAATFLGAVGWRLLLLGNQLFMTGVLGGAILLPMILGLWLQRWGFFAKARERLGVMWAIAGGGLLISVAGALPAVWLLVQAPQVPTWYLFVVTALHQVTGLAGAVGFAALMALVGSARPRILLPFLALGTMSLSGYLAQSVVAVVVYPASGLNVGATATSTEAFLISVGTWVLTLILATIIFALGRRGPAEWVFRRLLYGRAAARPVAPTDPPAHQPTAPTVTS